MKTKIAQPDSGQLQARREPRHGVAAVEFAMVASLLFLLILGIVEIGRSMMVLELLNNAARNGCRVGILTGSTNDTVTTSVNNTLTNTGVTGSTATIQVNGVTTNVSSAVVGDSVTVTVTVPYSRVTWLPVTLFMGNRSLTGTSVMRHE